MINLYLGNPGSGKSLHSSGDIRFALEHGQCVIANFKIKTELFRMADDSKFVYIPQESLKFPFIVVKHIVDYRKEHSGRILIMLDECQMLFDNRKWKDPGRDEWVLFFTHHRKLMGDTGEIILVTQREASIDPKIYDLVEYKSYHRKICNFGRFGFILGLLTGDRVHQYITYWAPLREVVSSRFFLRKKRDCDIYDTNYMFGLFDNINFDEWVKKAE